MKYLVIILTGILIYFQGIKPVVADYYYFKYKKGDKHSIAKSLQWNPDNTIVQLESGNLDRVASWQNGDVTEYSIWYMVAVQQLKAGNIPGGIASLNRSLWLYPDFAPALDLKKQIEDYQSGKK